MRCVSICRVNFHNFFFSLWLLFLNYHYWVKEKRFRKHKCTSVLHSNEYVVRHHHWCIGFHYIIIIDFTTETLGFGRFGFLFQNWFNNLIICWHAQCGVACTLALHCATNEAICEKCTALTRTLVVVIMVVVVIKMFTVKGHTGLDWIRDNGVSLQFPVLFYPFNWSVGWIWNVWSCRYIVLLINWKAD